MKNDDQDAMYEVTIEGVEDLLSLLLQNLPSICEQQRLIDEFMDIRETKGLNEQDALTYVFGPHMDKLIQQAKMKLPRQ